MIRAYNTLKSGSILLLLLDNGRLVSGPPIHAQISQAFAKTAWRNQLISSVRRLDGLWFGVDRHHA
jgi:hypothetical protein